MEHLSDELQSEVKSLRTIRHHYFRSFRTPLAEQWYTLEECQTIANGICRRVSNALSPHKYNFRCNICRFCDASRDSDNTYPVTLRRYYTIRKFDQISHWESVPDTFAYLDRTHPGLFTREDHQSIIDIFQHRLIHNIIFPTAEDDHISSTICDKVRVVLDTGYSLIFRCGVCPKCRLTSERDAGCAFLLRYRPPSSELSTPRTPTNFTFDESSCANSPEATSVASTSAAPTEQ